MGFESGEKVKFTSKYDPLSSGIYTISRKHSREENRPYLLMSNGIEYHGDLYELVEFPNDVIPESSLSKV